ncbi:unnamed protein product [Arctogadus glacialis]
MTVGLPGMLSGTDPSWQEDCALATALQGKTQFACKIPPPPRGPRGGDEEQLLLPPSPTQNGCTPRPGVPPDRVYPLTGCPPRPGVPPDRVTHYSTLEPRLGWPTCWAVLEIAAVLVSETGLSRVLRVWEVG